MENRRIVAAFAEAEYRGLVLAMRARIAACAAIALWTMVENQQIGGVYYTSLALVFAALGVLPVWLHRPARRWVWYVFPALDVGLFTLAILIPNPLDPTVVPPQFRLRWGNEVYLLLFIVAQVFTYRPGVVLWTGVAAAIAWSVGTFAIVQHPESLWWVHWPPGLSTEAIMRLVLNPHYVSLGEWGRIVVVVLVLAGTLAMAVRRSRTIVVRQAEAERARANLARYFSPNVVDELATVDEPLGRTREQTVTVLFVDVVGFTALAADRSPEAVIQFLREFHSRMVEVVFAHGGTVEKYLGDGLMVTFGTPRPRPDDAARALRCGAAMIDHVRAWSRERGEPVSIGVGLHHGRVVLGDIGDERHLEFAVIGDTVNVASRLQQHTRLLRVTLLASDAAVAEARAAGGDVPAALSPFPPQALRGIEAPIAVWGLPSEDSPAVRGA